MIRHSLGVIALVLLVATEAAAQQIYRVDDDKEGVVFTDRPKTLEGKGAAEKVELSPTNRADAVEVREDGDKAVGLSIKTKNRQGFPKAQARRVEFAAPPYF